MHLGQHKETLRITDIYWLTAALVFATLPHLTRVPLWATGLMALIALYTLGIHHRKVKQPGKFLLLLVTLTLFSAIFLQYSRILGRDAGSALLIVMLFLKLLEAKGRRDAMVIITMSCFLVITNFFYTQSIPTAFYMLAVVWIIISALIQINHPDAHASTAKHLRLSATTLLQALPIMLFLFILFPRIPGPLWSLPTDANSGKTGLSDSMSPGSIGHLAQSNDVAFRVKFKDPIPPSNQLYWRGIILSNYDGRTWRAQKRYRSKKPSAPKNTTQRTVRYNITLEPHDKRWLFVLDMPSPKTSYPHGIKLNQNYLLYSSRPIANLKQYAAESIISDTLNISISQRQYNAALQLPKNFNPKTIALARQWRQQAPTDEAVIAKALQYYRQQAFYYTLNPPLLQSKHSIDEFLFSSRRGFCEHYAGSFVFLMRAVGIPARVVTGYQGGELNPLSDYMVVRQSDAHAWAEVWLDNKGWTRIDPTAAVSPQRIEEGLDASIPNNEIPGFILKRSDTLYITLSFAWDTLNNRWNEWVLGYGPETQRQFLSLIGFAQARITDFIMLLSIALTLAISGISYYIFRNKRSALKDPVDRSYQQFCNIMERAGYPKYAYEGAQGYQHRIDPQIQKINNDIKQITVIYTKLRYANIQRKYTAALIRKMKKHIKAIREKL